MLAIMIALFVVPDNLQIVIIRFFHILHFPVQKPKS